MTGGTVTLERRARSRRRDGPDRPSRRGRGRRSLAEGHRRRGPPAHPRREAEHGGSTADGAGPGQGTRHQPGDGERGVAGTGCRGSHPGARPCGHVRPRHRRADPARRATWGSAARRCRRASTCRRALRIPTLLPPLREALERVVARSGSWTTSYLDDPVLPELEALLRRELALRAGPPDRRRRRPRRAVARGRPGGAPRRPRRDREPGLPARSSTCSSEAARR